MLGPVGHHFWGRAGGGGGGGGDTVLEVGDGSEKTGCTTSISRHSRQRGGGVNRAWLPLPCQRRQASHAPQPMALGVEGCGQSLGGAGGGGGGGWLPVPEAKSAMHLAKRLLQVH